MKILLYTWIITLVGFTLTPNEVFACNSKSEKKENGCCSKESTSEKKSSQDCCKSEKENKKNDCGGTCGDPSCHCPSLVTNFIVPNFNVSFQQKYIVIKSNFINIESLILSGFLSIWIPPKIF